MGLPTPTQDQIDALTDLKALADAGVFAGSLKVAALNDAKTKQQKIENFQKESFDLINDEIIRRYEVERRWLDGLDLTAPILEVDIQDFAAGDNSGRLWNNDLFPPVRISELDGTPLVLLEQEHEEAQLGAQDVLLDALENGLTGIEILDNGAKIESSINSGSSSARILLNAEPISIGHRFVVSGGGNTAIVEIVTITGFCTGENNPPQTNQTACETDNGTWTAFGDITFIYIVPPVGTIPANSDIGQKSFGGFNNTERTNQIANDSDLQGVMNSLLLSLENVLNNRITALNNQINELQNNENDNLPASAETNANTSKIAVQNFLGISPVSTIDISDTGITAFDSEKATRAAQVTQRILDIASEIDFGVDDSASYYDLRFNSIEGRCRLNNGSIILLRDLTVAIDQINAGTTEAQGLSDRYNTLIP